MQNFLGRLPIGFNVVILSIHGFFGQANVLGKPDTGGQVSTRSFSRCWWCAQTLCAKLTVKART